MGGGWRAGGLAAAFFLGLGAAAGAARDLVDPPADLALDASAPAAAPAAPHAIAKKPRQKTPKPKAAALKAAPAVAATPAPPRAETPAIASKAAAGGDDPLSVGMKWNGTKEPDYGAATSLRQINQQIDSHILGGSSQPIGAGAEVGVKYKF